MTLHGYRVILEKSLRDFWPELNFKDREKTKLEAEIQAVEDFIKAAKKRVRCI